MFSRESDTIDGFAFVWFIDEIDWNSVRGNQIKIFDVIEYYTIDDMEQDVIKQSF